MVKGIFIFTLFFTSRLELDVEEFGLLSGPEGHSMGAHEGKK